MHKVRIPAFYKGTGEPIILDCVVAQLGDQAVYQQINREAPAVEVFPTQVFRVHIFKDTWPEEPGWNQLIEKPIKCLVEITPLLRLCKDETCTSCECYHPSIEEQGIESGLLDVWSFRWATLAGAKVTPDKADVLSIFVRTPESTFQSLHVMSGTDGIFFEPRQADAPGSDPTYSVIWVNQMTLGDALHRVKTHDLCLAACRLGNKIGIRCAQKKHKELYEELFPNKTFTECQVKLLYRIDPLPAGTQRQSLVNILAQMNWAAKPLQAIKGSQGRAWQIGAESEPPRSVIETQNGWVTITKVKDAATPVKQSNLIATAKTRQHIKGAVPSSSAASSTSDPWLGGQDPWANWQQGDQGKPSTKASAVPPSQHVQQKFDDVEQRLSDHISATLSKEVSNFKQNNDAEMRIDAIESQIATLVENQGKLEHWIQDGSSKVYAVQQEQQALSQAVQHCQHQIGEQGQAIAGVATEIGKCRNEVTGLRGEINHSLESYFAQQADKIEALLAKKLRH